MKKLFLFALAVTALFSSCEKDPDLNKLSSDYAVYTNYDSNVQFNKFNSYYLPDSILVAGSGLKAQYWKDENAQKIINEVVTEMDARGYTRIDDKEKADIGLQLSYAQSTTQIISPDMAMVTAGGEPVSGDHSGMTGIIRILFPIVMTPAHLLQKWST